MRIRPEKIRYTSDPAESAGSGSVGLMAALLTVAIVVGSAFFDTAVGGGAYLLLTVPLSPVIFGILYLLLKRSR